MFSARARTPATEVIERIVPCPCLRSCTADASPAETAPTKLVWTTRAANIGSVSISVCPSRIPNPRMTMSRSPMRSTAASMTFVCEAGSRASKTTVSASIPAARSRLMVPEADAGDRTPSSTLVQRLATSLSTMARAISELPPSTSTDCTEPKASRMCVVPLLGLGAVSARLDGHRLNLGSTLPDSS